MKARLPATSGHAEEHRKRSHKLQRRDERRGTYTLRHNGRQGILKAYMATALSPRVQFVARHQWQIRSLDQSLD